MMTKFSSRLSVLFGALFVLSACGGGGGGGGGTTEVVPTEKPAAPVLSIGFGIKQLQFSWPAASGASYYHLLENPDGVSGYIQVGGDITTTTATRDIAIYTHDWPNARYMVEACNSLGCTASNEVNTVGDALKPIGYLKSPTPHMYDSFGLTAALSQDGTTLAVGAVGVGNTGYTNGDGMGAVYLYVRSATGLWSHQATLAAPNPDLGDWFGYALALSSDGNTLAVGAPNEAGSGTGIDPVPDNSADKTGAVYLFSRSGSSWSAPVYIKASTLNLFSAFGTALDLSDDGNLLAVGAPKSSDGGRVYTFTRSSGVWSQKQIVTGSNTGAGDLFGQSLALNASGSILVVGAPQEDSGTSGINTTPDEAATDAGAVYAYLNDIYGVLVQKAYIKAPNTGAGDYFGQTVALGLDATYGSYRLFVGAVNEDSNATTTCTYLDATCAATMADNSASNAGAVYDFYSASGFTWMWVGYLKGSNTGAGDGFGYSLAVDGTGHTLAVGATNEDGSSLGFGGADDNAASNAGAVYLFSMVSNTVWSQFAYLKAPNTGAGDKFGSAVAFNGDGTTLAVSGYWEKSGTSLICATGDAACAAAQADDSMDGAGAIYLY